MRIFSALFFILFASTISFAQTAEKEAISTAIREGNSNTLGNYLIASVDLTVENVEDVYSKDQAEVILARFFAQNKPTGFTIKHEGKSKLDDYYYIGDLQTATSKYRLTFFLKKDGTTFRVKQLRIEAGN